MSLEASDYNIGPIEPFNERTRRRAEISALRKAYVGEPRQNRDSCPQRLFDACGGDFYLTVLAAVKLHILQQREAAQEAS